MRNFSEQDIGEASRRVPLGKKHTAAFMSYSMLTSVKCSEAGIACVFAAVLALSTTGRVHSVVSRRDLESPWNGSCAGHDIHWWSMCRVERQRARNIPPSTRPREGSKSTQKTVGRWEGNKASTRLGREKLKSF